VELGARIVAVGGELAPGDARPVRVVLDGPVVTRAGDRFVLRSPSPLVTIGGGTVRDPLPPSRRARPWPADVGTADAALALIVAEAVGQGVASSDLPLRLGLTPPRAAVLAASTDRAWRLVHGRLYHRAAVASVAATLLRLVDEAHANAPLEPGISTQSVRAKLHASADLVDALLREAVGAGELELDGGIVRRGGWKPTLRPSEAAALHDLAATLEAAGREPPAVSELGVVHGPSTAAILRLLERERRVVQVEPDRYYSAVVLADLMAALRSHMERGRVYNPSELRELLGVSRKYLIPLLEYADRAGVTDRRADGRVIRGT
jgi:selenocysteine-specific elongation factor